MWPWRRRKHLWVGGWLRFSETLVYHYTHTHPHIHRHGALYIAPSLSLFKLFNQTQISSDRRGNKLAALYWPQGTRFRAGRAKNGGVDEEETRPRYTALYTIISVYLYVYIYTHIPAAYGVKTSYIYERIHARFSFYVERAL